MVGVKMHKIIILGISVALMDIHTTHASNRLTTAVLGLMENARIINFRTIIVNINNKYLLRCAQ